MLDNRFNNRSARVAFALWLAVASAASADETFVDSVLGCRSLSTAGERLSCYDDIVDDYSQRAAGPVANKPPESADADQPLASEQSFGMPPAADRQAEIDQIDASIAELSQTASGKYVVVLDNGQVWRQTTSSSLRLAEGDEVVIRRRSLGSYKLTKVGSARSIKVKREK